MYPFSPHKQRFLSRLCAGFVMMAVALPVGAVDKNIPEYQKVSGVAGTLSSVGSDTLANLMTFWTEDFRRLYPSVRVQVQAAGSSTAPPALTEGASSLGPMSREMKSKEIAAFERRHGYKPTAIPVAIDALAVFVHKRNRIAKLSMLQVDAIFSSTRQCGGEKSIEQWKDLGIPGRRGEQRIELFGRNSVSGTYGYFKKVALCKGDYKSQVNEQPGSASVIQSVAASRRAIGYSGIGYITAGVRAVSISETEGSRAIEPTIANAVNGSYPLTRFLYIYVNKAPGKPLDKLTQEFLEFVLSQQGQKVVEKDGYVALPASEVRRALQRIR